MYIVKHGKPRIAILDQESLHEDLMKVFGKKVQGGGKGKDFLKDLEDALSLGSDNRDTFDRMTRVVLAFIDKDKEVKKAMSKSLVWIWGVGWGSDGRGRWNDR